MTTAVIASQSVQHDVVVIGAGPAAAATAIRLAELGLDTAIVGRRPGSQPGLCIADETIALVEHLGVGEEFAAARFWRRSYTAVMWESSTTLVAQAGYNVDRRVLDEILIQRASAVGVCVHQPVGVPKLARSSDQGWEIAIAGGTGNKLIRARFLVDAAGRSPALRGRRIRDGAPLMAMHAGWVLDAPCPFDGLIEAGPDGWLWFARTASRRGIVSVFCDPRRLKVGRSADLQTAYRDLASRFNGFARGLRAMQITASQACDASSLHAAEPIGKDFIRVGDSCCCVDPLSSQGIHLALLSGLQGAVIVNTILNRRENAAIAGQFYRERVAERIRQYTHATRREYTRARAVWTKPFWQERSTPEPTDVHPDRPPPPLPPSSATVTVSPDTAVRSAPVIEGAFVEMRPIVTHPGFDRGIAYVQGIDLARLLSVLPNEVGFGEIPILWGDQAPPPIGRGIAEWLWSKRLLVQAT